MTLASLILRIIDGRVYFSAYVTKKMSGISYFSLHSISIITSHVAGRLIITTIYVNTACLIFLRRRLFSGLHFSLSR